MAIEWLKAQHLMRDQTYQMFSLTIKEVKNKGHGLRYENKQPVSVTGGGDAFILLFEQTDKWFAITSRVNEKLITAQLGSDIRHWPGESITLLPVIGNWFGETNLLATRIFVDPDKPRPKINADDFGTSVVGVRVGSKREKSHE